MCVPFWFAVLHVRFLLLLVPLLLLHCAAAQSFHHLLHAPIRSFRKLHRIYFSQHLALDSTFNVQVNIAILHLVLDLPPQLTDCIPWDYILNERVAPIRLDESCIVVSSCLCCLSFTHCTSLLLLPCSFLTIWGLTNLFQHVHELFDHVFQGRSALFQQWFMASPTLSVFAWRLQRSASRSRCWRSSVVFHTVVVAAWLFPCGPMFPCRKRSQVEGTSVLSGLVNPQQEFTWSKRASTQGPSKKHGQESFALSTGALYFLLSLVRLGCDDCGTLTLSAYMLASHLFGFSHCLHVLLFSRALWLWSRRMRPPSCTNTDESPAANNPSMSSSGFATQGGSKTSNEARATQQEVRRNSTPELLRTSQHGFNLTVGLNFVSTWSQLRLNLVST